MPPETPAAESPRQPAVRVHPRRALARHASEPPKSGAGATEAEELLGRAEDDAYLRIVDLAQRGRVEEARAAAKDYLLRFPNGFRRLEVLNMVTRTPP